MKTSKENRSLISFVKKVPGGNMIVPMLIAALINTFMPSFFTLGSYSKVLYSSQGMITLMCVTLFFTGCQLDVKDIPQAVKRGGSHVLFKYVAGAVFFILIQRYFGYEGIFGVSSLALLCSLTNCNSTLYMGLMEQYGDPIDMAARPLFNLNSGPALSLLTLGVSGVDGISWFDIISIMMPLLIGILLSVADKNIKEITKSAVKLLTPVSGFIIGSQINLMNAITSGLGGIILVIIVFSVTGPVALFVDRILLKRPGYGGMATVSVAGNTVAVPAMIGAAVASYQPYVESAMVQISAAIVISAVICPVLVDFIYRRYGADRYSKDVISD
ncbi:MAG: 2-keto-3-deoxygluconate permease [Suipraeoptans sp.]